jgi:type IV pilus assembly protein PilY1
MLVGAIVSTALAGVGKPCAAAALPGQLPTAYVVASAGYPWTGRLRALAFRPTLATRSVTLPNDAWEAGALLDARGSDARRLLTAARAPSLQDGLTTLSWDTLDSNTKALLGSARTRVFEPDKRFAADGGGHGMDDRENDMGRLGQSRLAWLRGERTPGDGLAAMKPRDTRLGNGRRARVRVVGPPQWLPGRPDHDAFRARHQLRATTVWLGTNDGLLHGFDAVSGKELTAYLPAAMLAGAAQAAEAGTPAVAPPCPRPEATDVRIDGNWHTVLLCGSAAQDGTAASVFALDITELASGDVPTLRLLWTLSADADLPLSPAGPVRAVELDDHGQPRWFAVSAIGPRKAESSRTEAPSPSPSEPPPAEPGLALIPLDKPAGAPWRGRYAIVRLPLAAQGCDGGPPTALLATTMHTDLLRTHAPAAYAVDASGRLWRFALGAALSGTSPASRAICLHVPPSPVEQHQTEAPHIATTPGGAMVVFGAGNSMTAIVDDGAAAPSPLPPRLVGAEPADDGVILRAAPDPSGRVVSTGGWRIALPGTDERLDEILDAGTGYVAFVTRTADDQLHGYLIRTATGESVVREKDGTPAGAAITGRRLGAAGETAVIVHREPASPQPGGEPPPVPGETGRSAFDISLWAVTGNVARPVGHTVASRRTGRLGWRELMLPSSAHGAP